MRIFFSWLMTFVFAFEPFLQTRAADKLNGDALIQQIKASSLGVKGKTYGDLYMFIKMNVPSRFADRFAQLLLNRRHDPLPEIEFSKFKTKEGHEGVKMILSESGLSHTLEIVNEDAIFAKLDGVPLNWRDIDSVTPALNKIIARNPNLYNRVAPTGVFKQNPTVIFNPKAHNSTFGGNFLIPMKENWARWTPVQRARFITEVRKTWQASLAVENFIPKSGGISRQSAAVLHPFFLNALAIDEAFAAAAKNECKAPMPPLDSKCIHSGFIGLVTRNGGFLNCSHPSELTTAQLLANQDIASQKIPSDCTGGAKRACNPALYGHQREGAKNRTICVDVNARQNKGQDVTHWQGACEVESPLDTTKEVKLKGISGMEPWLAEIEIDPGNVTLETKNKIRKKMEQSGVALDNAAAQLASSLKLDASIIRGKQLGQDGSQEKASIFQTIETFYIDINAKLAVCKAMYKDGQKAIIDRNPKNRNCDFSQQLGACQQLFRRKLVMDALVGNLCPLQVYQLGNPQQKNAGVPFQTITEDYNDAKLETIQQGSFDPSKACMEPAVGLGGARSVGSGAAVVLEPPRETKNCELAITSKDYTLKADRDICLCVNKDPSKPNEFAILDLNNTGKYTCPEEKESSINPLIPLGVIGAGLLIYAINRDKKSRLGECPANTTRVGENCYFTPICDKVRYPEITMVNNQCVLPGNCVDGSTKSADGKCVYPGVCPLGSKIGPDGKTCVADCPPNTKTLSNGTCQWGVACPMLGGQIVYDLAQCSEGNGTTPAIPGAGGVQ